MLRQLTTPMLCASLFLVGCTVQSTTPEVLDTEMGSSETQGQNSEVAVASTAPDVRLISIDEFKALMSSQEGKVVLLDMWANW